MVLDSPPPPPGGSSPPVPGIRAAVGLCEGLWEGLWDGLCEGLCEGLGVGADVGIGGAKEEQDAVHSSSLQILGKSPIQAVKVLMSSDASQL